MLQSLFSLMHVYDITRCAASYIYIHYVVIISSRIFIITHIFDFLKIFVLYLYNYYIYHILKIDGNQKATAELISTEQTHKSFI